MDLIHVTNQVIEKSAQYSQLLYMAFIDYEKAFDSMEIRAVIEALHNQGVPDAHVNILVNPQIFHGYLGSPPQSKMLPIKKRVGQTISARLFTACLDLFKTLDWEG